MAKILTVDSRSLPPEIEKEAEKESFFKKLSESFQSLDKFTKITVLAFLLIIVATPFVISNRQIFNQRAQGPNSQSNPSSLNSNKPLSTNIKEEYVPDQILLKFKEGVPDKTKKNILNTHGLTEIQEIPQIKVKVLKVPEQARDRVIEALSRNPAVKFAEKNGITYATSVPNDPYFGQQWGMTKIQAPQAWDITTGSSSVPIAILDTGIAPTHEDLAGKIIKSVNFSSSTTTDDMYGHGTHVSGIAAALTNNGLGVAGLGYNSSLMNVKVMDDNTGTGTFSSISSGIIWAADNGAKVINMSLGASTTSSAMGNAVKYAWNKGVVLVAAAGNSHTSSPSYPAYYANVIAVAATDIGDNLALFSNYGAWVDVAAPGVDIYSTLPTGGTCVMCGDPSGYRYGTGTSDASPFVAGLAALVLTRVQDNNTARACIQNNADDLGITGIGSGRINAYKAVLCGNVTPPPPDTTPPTASITYPTNGETVSGGVNVNVSATDNVSVSNVELYIDNSLFATDTSTPYGFYWDTTTVSNGTHTIYSKAYDPSNNIGTSSTVTITVSNALPTPTPTETPIPTPTPILVTQIIPPDTPTPTPIPTAIPTPTPLPSDTIAPYVTISSPLNGSTIGNSVNISAYATDNVVVISMQLYIDGNLITTSSTSTISRKWNNRKVAAGTHTITVKATDPSNNVGSSSVTVNK